MAVHSLLSSSGMRRRPAVLTAFFGLLATFVSANGNSAAARRVQPPAPTLTVAAGTRLLVVAPHPDDETLGAGGLMQRVKSVGGTVHVVYLTDGDGYPEGVEVEDHVETPKPADYRGYGRRRKREAKHALAVLGIDDRNTTFLSFPDGGLCRLMRTYWSERRAAYRSPYTRRDRPPQTDIIVPDTEYRGEDLTQELARVIGEFRPTLIVVTRPADQHADHCAAWYFVKDALGDVQRVIPDYAPDLLTYIVHYNTWPFETESARLDPPRGLAGGASGWIRFPLTPAEVKTKRAALAKYESQMKVLDWFLDGFARTNEIFSRPVPSRVVLPSKGSPCCDR